MQTSKEIFDKLLEVDSIIYSRRKSLSIIISEDGLLIVRAPHKYPTEHINRILREKKDWILKHKLKANQVQQKYAEFARSKKIPFLGRLYPFTANEDGVNDVFFQGNRIVVRTKKGISPLPVLTRWYGNQAKETVMPLIEKYCYQTNVSCLSVKITKAKTRWGSCNHNKKSINLSWRIMMTPLNVIEYVVLHEVIHLKIPNHSKIFWAEVAKFMPDYEERKHWLQNRGYMTKIDSLFLS